MPRTDPRHGRQIRRSNRSIWWLIFFLTSLALASVSRGQGVSILQSLGNGTVSAAVNQPFSYQITATNTPTGYVSSALPLGLTLNGTTGLISGTPTAVGTTNVTIIAGNAAGNCSSTLVITVVPPPAITGILTVFGSLGSDFYYQIQASGTPSSFNVTGLPGNLTLNSATGVIYGTPQTAGTFPVTISVSNVAGTDSQTLTLVISSSAPTVSQEYVQIHSFNDGSVAGEGIYPGRVVQAQDSTFYGMISAGGGAASESIFHISAARNASVLAGLGAAGGSTPSSLIQGSDGNFYGTTPDGGSKGKGTLFKVTPDGTVTVLHTFGDGTVANDGANPTAGVIEGQNGNFYGTTQYGGSANLGTLFEMTSQGVVTTIHSFGDGTVTSDGAQPQGALTAVSAILYGTSTAGGSANNGTVFSYVLGGPVATLHSFGDGTVTNDGSLPMGGLFAGEGDTSGYLYGTTNTGGSAGKGTVYEILPAVPSSVVTILHNFGDGTVTNDGTNPTSPPVSFALGATPALPLAGTTQNGGAAGQGAVYEIDASGNYSLIHNFGDGTTPNDGQIPSGGLCLGTDGNLYGTTIGGGAGYGTLYAIATNVHSGTGEPGATLSTWSMSGTLPSGMTFDSATGIISGTPFSSDGSGSYTVSISHDVNGIDLPAQNITINLALPFSKWPDANHSGLSLTGSLFTDQVPNLLKYLYDINPVIPISPNDRALFPTAGLDTWTTPGTTYLAITYRQYALATGVSVAVQTSSDLQNWTTIDPPAVFQKVGEDDSTLTHDPIMEIGVLATGSNQYIRLNVTSP